MGLGQAPGIRVVAAQDLLGSMPAFKVVSRRIEGQFVRNALATKKTSVLVKHDEYGEMTTIDWQNVYEGIDAGYVRSLELYEASVDAA